MKLKRVVIQNFKSFSNVDFDLNDHRYFDVLIGTNDSGKSNFLQALDIKKIFEKGFENKSFKFSDDADTLIRLFFQPNTDDFLTQFIEKMKQSFEETTEYYLNEFLKIHEKIVSAQNKTKWKSNIKDKIRTLIDSNLSLFSNFEKKDLHNEKFCFVWELKHQSNNNSKKWGLSLFFSFKKKIWKPLEEAVNMIKKELKKNQFEEIDSLNKGLDNLIDSTTWFEKKINLEMVEFLYLRKNFFQNNDEKKVPPLFVTLYFWFFLIQFQILAKQFWNESIIWSQDTFFDDNPLKSEYSIEEFIKNENLLNFLTRNKSSDDQKTVKHFLKGNTWQNLKGSYLVDIEKIFSIQNLVIETSDLNENSAFNDNDIKKTIQLELYCRIRDHIIQFWVNDKEKDSSYHTELNQRSKGFKALIRFWMIYSHLFFSSSIKEKSYKIENISNEKIKFFSQSIFDNYSETEELKFFLSFWEKSFYKFFNNNIFENFSFKLLLIDEPENHFHASRQKSILNKLIKSSQDNKVNVFVATHSPWFVNWQNSASTMVIERISAPLKNKFESQIYACLDDFQQKNQKNKNENEKRLNLKHNSLIPIQLALGAEFDFVFLETGKKFVFVEGNTDVLIFKWFWEKKQPKYKNLIFVSLHGDLKSNSLIFAAAMNMPLIVLADDDQGGSNIISSLDSKPFWQLYKQKFVKHKINCSLTLGEISSELTTIESIFNEKERKDLFLKEPKDKQPWQKNNDSNNKKNYSKQSQYLKTLSKLYEKKIDDFSSKTIKKLNQIFDFINDLFQKMENKK